MLFAGARKGAIVGLAVALLVACATLAPNSAQHAGAPGYVSWPQAVSYTHLTLPTILRV